VAAKFCCIIHLTYRAELYWLLEDGQLWAKKVLVIFITEVRISDQIGLLTIYALPIPRKRY